MSSWTQITCKSIYTLLVRFLSLNVFQICRAILTVYKASTCNRAVLVPS